MQAGRRFGPYEIVAPLGAGGMGEVFRARDTRIGREVAIKFLAPDAVASADRLRRFEQESRTTGSLNHPNLVTIHDVGTDNGAPYIVMELLDGHTLRDCLEELPQRKAVDYAVQLAQGLAAAHDKGIIHRDLKPENIFITRDGRVKILDFGLAKLKAPVEGKTEAPTEQRGTAPGTVMGTVGYMSPEQVRGEELDHRTDIFSLGTILYEMLSGRRAFQGNTAADTMSAILREDPPELPPSQPFTPALGHIVRHCLEKNPAERFQSARDLAFDLQTASGISGASGQTAGRAPVRRVPWVRTSAGVLALAAAVVGGYMAGTRRMPDGKTAPVAVNASQLTFRSGVEAFPSIAPDGKTFVFVSRAAGNNDIYLQRVEGQSAINLTRESLADDTQPALSPSGSLIAFRSERDGGGLYVMGATGEAVRRISDFGFNPSWAPDGKEIACSTERVTFSPQSRTSDSELWIINVASGNKWRVTAQTRPVQPAWSPRGHRIAYWGISGAGQRDLYTIDARATGGAPKALLSDAALDWNPVWSPDGRYLYFGSDRGGTLNLWRLPIDEATGQARGTPEQIPLPARYAAHFSIAHDGKHIVFSALEMASAVRRAPLRDVGRRGSTVVSGSMLIFTFDISPDGQWLAFSNAGMQEDLYVVSVNGGELRQITNDGFRDRAPTWTPDGKRLVFYSNRSGNMEIWQINIDGSGLYPLTNARAQLWFPQMSPDGKRLTAIDAGRTYMIEMSGNTAGKPQPLPRPTRDMDFRASDWSPDARKIAGVLNRPADRTPVGVAVYDVARKSYQIVRRTGGRARWMPDGRSLLILDGGSLIVTSLDGKEIVRYAPLTQMNIVAGAEPFWTDGKEIYWVEQMDQADIWLVRLPEQPE
jgi:Tol biopolymer transport system component/predicted Ser/Thr protein kinase